MEYIKKRDDKLYIIETSGWFEKWLYNPQDTQEEENFAEKYIDHFTGADLLAYDLEIDSADYIIEGYDLQESTEDVIVIDLNAVEKFEVKETGLEYIIYKKDVSKFDNGNERLELIFDGFSSIVYISHLNLKVSDLHKSTLLYKNFGIDNEWGIDLDNWYTEELQEYIKKLEEQDEVKFNVNYSIVGGGYESIDDGHYTVKDIYSNDLKYVDEMQEGPICIYNFTLTK